MRGLLVTNQRGGTCAVRCRVGGDEGGGVLNEPPCRPLAPYHAVVWSPVPRVGGDGDRPDVVEGRAGRHGLTGAGRGRLRRRNRIRVRPWGMFAHTEIEGGSPR